MTGHHPFSGKPLPPARPFSRPLTEAEAETVMRNLDKPWPEPVLAEARDVHLAAQRRVMCHLRYNWIEHVRSHPTTPDDQDQPDGLTQMQALTVVLLCLIAGGLGLLGAHLIGMFLWGWPL